MATSSFYKFNCFVQDIGREVHNLNATDTLKILLTNTAPNAADTIVDDSETPCKVEATSNAVEIAAGSGYTKGGAEVASAVYAQTSGTAKLYGVKASWTASGTWPTFRYAVLYNASGGSAGNRPVIGYFDYGAGGVTLTNGETFTIGNSNDGTDWTSTYPILTIA